MQNVTAHLFFYRNGYRKKNKLLGTVSDLFRHCVIPSTRLLREAEREDAKRDRYGFADFPITGACLAVSLETRRTRTNSDTHKSHETRPVCTAPHYEGRRHARP